MPATGGTISSKELMTIKDHVTHLERAVNETDRLVGILSQELLGKGPELATGQITGAKIGNLSVFTPGVKQRTEKAVERLDKLNKVLDNLKRELTQANDIVGNGLVAENFQIHENGNAEFRGTQI